MTFAAGIAVGRAPQLQAAGKNRVLEIRTYTTNEGRLPALVERMGHGEGKVFERLGMKPVLFSVAAEAPKSQNTFVYILSHESLAKAKENWDVALESVKAALDLAPLSQEAVTLREAIESEQEASIRFAKIKDAARANNHEEVLNLFAGLPRAASTARARCRCGEPPRVR